LPVGDGGCKPDDTQPGFGYPVGSRYLMLVLVF